MIMSLRKIKSVGATAALCCIALSTPTQGAQAVPAIMPIITEFAIDLWPKIADRVRSLTTREGQCMVCGKTGGLSCNATLFKKVCKTRCQERVEMGSGYILKIRFAGKWNMRTCMQAEAKACQEAIKKKKKTDADCANQPSSSKEIAVYNRHDLNIAKELITKIVACEHIIAQRGKITPKTSKQDAEQELNQTLKDIGGLFTDQGNFEPANSEAALDMLKKIGRSNMIVTSYSEEEDKRTPAERVKEAEEERKSATEELAKLVPSFGPQ
jgi:hypothetical protein